MTGYRDIPVFAKAEPEAIPRVMSAELREDEEESVVD
jgi:hypothetical protein